MYAIYKKGKNASSINYQ